MIIKTAFAGIVVLAVIAFALMPSPGSPQHPADASLTEPAGQTATTNVTVVPQQVVVAVNQEFNVEVWINNVTDMAGWEIRLLWDSEIIKCVKAQVNTPPEWGGAGFDWFNKAVSDVDPNAVYTAWQFGAGVDNNYDATHGQYFKAECYGPHGSPYQNTFNGSIAIVRLTFQALQAGSTSLSFWRTEYNSTAKCFQDCKGVLIGNSDATEIASTSYDGLVEVKAP